MKLKEALKRSSELVATCLSPACATRTKLDARFFTSRYGLDADIADIAKTLVCAACGNDAIVLGIST